jgi:hypothetical protein
MSTPRFAGSTTTTTSPSADDANTNRISALGAATTTGNRPVSELPSHRGSNEPAVTHPASSSGIPNAAGAPSAMRRAVDVAPTVAATPRAITLGTSGTGSRFLDTSSIAAYSIRERARHPGPARS